MGNHCRVGVILFVFACFVGNLAVTIYCLTVYITKSSLPHIEIDIQYTRFLDDLKKCERVRGESTVPKTRVSNALKKALYTSTHPA